MFPESLKPSALPLLPLVMMLVTGCAKVAEMPAVDGATIEVVRSKESRSKGDAGFSSTLQILWFGSACHEIRLSDLGVVTDPFVTNGLTLGALDSDPHRVGETLGRLRPPAAVIVNHSHYDHLLDAHAAMSLPDWKKDRVQLFGSPTTRHLLAAWRDAEVTSRCHALTAGDAPVTSGNGRIPGVPAGYQLRIRAFRGAHNPHVGCGKVFLSGTLQSPPDKPDSLFDYPCGEVLNYLLEMTSPDGSAFKVVFLGGPGDPSWIPKASAPVDVVIVPTPGAAFLDKHLVRHLEILRPRHIVLNHFNNFFACDAGHDHPTAKDPDERNLPLDFPKVQWLSREIQKHYIARQDGRSGFEKLHIPSLTRMTSRGVAKNVILITKPAR